MAKARFILIFALWEGLVGVAFGQSSQAKLLGTDSNGQAIYEDPTGRPYNITTGGQINYINPNSDGTDKRIGDRVDPSLWGPGVNMPLWLEPNGRRVYASASPGTSSMRPRRFYNLRSLNGPGGVTPPTPNPTPTPTPI